MPCEIPRTCPRVQSAVLTRRLWRRPRQYLVLTQAGLSILLAFGLIYQNFGVFPMLDTISDNDSVRGKWRNADSSNADSVHACRADDGNCPMRYAYVGDGSDINCRQRPLDDEGGPPSSYKGPKKAVLPCRLSFVHFVIADLRVFGSLFFHRPAVLQQGKPSRPASSHICVATPPPSFPSLFLLFAFSLRLLRATSANFRLLGAHLLPPFFALPLRNEDTYFFFSLSLFQQSYRAWALNSWHSSCVNPSARALFHETDLSLSHVSVDDAAYT